MIETADADHAADFDTDNYEMLIISQVKTFYCSTTATAHMQTIITFDVFLTRYLCCQTRGRPKGTEVPTRQVTLVTNSIYQSSQ